MQYIVFEGSDGTGKTTLSKACAKSWDYEWVFEPDATNEVTKQLREFVLNKRLSSIVNDSARELMLLASRAISTARVKSILGEWDTPVVSDRSFLSGMVYPNVISGMEFSDWWTVMKIMDVIKVFPDVIVNVTVDKRNINANKGDMYDNEPESFHSRIDSAFIQALDFIRDNTQILVMDFKNDFSIPVSTNVENLTKKLWKIK